MLLNNNTNTHLQGIYKCDRCSKELHSNNRYGIYIAESKCTAKKKWDLCDKCFSALKRGIEKGTKKEE